MRKLENRWLACAALLAGCSSSGNSATNPDAEAIDQLIQSIGALPTQAPHRTEGAPSAPAMDGDYQCVTTPVDEVRQYDQLLGQISVGDVLWPGDLLRGDSVAGTQLTPLSLERAPTTFSVSLESLSGTHSATLDHPSLSAYRDALGTILSQDLKGSASAKIYAEVDEVNSEQQLSIALGASVDAPLVAMVKAGFSFDNTQKRSRYIVKFFQIYYTVDVDPPSAPHAVFAPGVTADQVAEQAGDKNPPVFVSSIAYGRQVLFTFESDLSQQELQAALEFVYHGGVDVDGSVSLTHKEVLSHTHTTAFILGGNPGEAAMASIGSYDELETFISRGGEYTKDSPGAAIAYKLSYLADNQPVEISYASMYDRKTCERVSQKIHVSLDKITVDGGGTLKIFGDVDAYGVSYAGSLFSRTSANTVQINQNASFPTSGIVGEAIVAVDPHPGNAFSVVSHLRDQVDFLPDIDLGTLQTDAPYEAGWRRTLQVHHTAGDKQVTLQVTLTPI